MPTDTTDTPRRTVDCALVRCPRCAVLTGYNPRHPAGSACEHCGATLFEALPAGGLWPDTYWPEG